MKYIILILQIGLSSLIFAQTSCIVRDSVRIQSLKIKEYTLFLSFDSIGINKKRLKSNYKEYWYLIGSENYNTNMRIFNYVGFVRINNICILIREGYGHYSKYMFKSEDTSRNFYYYKDLSVKFPAYYVGSDVELVYKISKKRNNRYIIKKIN